MARDPGCCDGCQWCGAGKVLAALRSGGRPAWGGCGGSGPGPARLGAAEGFPHGDRPPRPGRTPDISALSDVAEALWGSLLGAPDAVSEQIAGLPGVVQLDSEDFQPALQQAAGALAWRNGWSVEDAIALVRARAYVEERSVAEVATDVLVGKPVFTDDD